MNNLKGKKILFATFPADGHFNPLTGLAKHLQALGCEIRWYASEIYAEKLHRLSIPHFIFDQAPDINPINVDKVLPQRKSITDPIGKLNYDLEHIFVNPSVGYYEDIKKIHASFPFELMIADSVFSGIPFVKNLMNIPVVSIGIVPLAEQSVDLPPYGMGLPPATDDAQRSEYVRLRELATHVLFKPSIDAFDSILRRHGILTEKSPMFNLLIKQADLYLQIGSESFEYQRSDLGENVRFVGALLPYASDDQQQPWYDTRIEKFKNVILVTQGTVEKDISKLLEPTLEAFSNTDNLVIATTGGNFTEELKQKYNADNLIIVDYIPFADVMRYATVYITNGGYSGTLLAIKHGLPLIAAGVHEGKNEVCTRIGYFNLGIDLQTESPSPAVIRNAVEEILSNQTYKKKVTGLFRELNDLEPYQRSVMHIRELIYKSAEQTKG